MDTSVQAARHFQWSFMVYVLPVDSSSEEDRDAPLTTTLSVSLESMMMVKECPWGGRRLEEARKVVDLYRYRSDDKSAGTKIMDVIDF